MKKEHGLEQPCTCDTFSPMSGDWAKIWGWARYGSNWVPPVFGGEEDLVIGFKMGTSIVAGTET